jgi:hypothetical protein
MPDGEGSRGASFVIAFVVVCALALAAAIAGIAQFVRLISGNSG